MGGEAPRVLFVDDEAQVRASHVQMLELEGFAVEGLESGERALPLLTRQWPGVLVTDVKMPGMDGIALLAAVQERDPELPVILLTGHGDVDMAVRAMRHGAYDFVEKPAEPARLLEAVHRAVDRRRLVLENRALRHELDALTDIEGLLIGKSSAMERVRRTVLDLAPVDVDVLIDGETGTGKELVARCLHDFGGRRAHPFVAINCGAMPESIVESELFGHEAGAFTGANRRRVGKVEHASGGTLFLDEIETMPLAVQARLLRVLQERTVVRVGGNDPIPVDLRVVAAAKGDLTAACAAGTFRDDLFFRLNVAAVSLPPVRDRLEDVPLLLAHFMHSAAQRFRRPAPEPGPALLAALGARDWPGNVREVRNEAERLVLGLTDVDDAAAVSGTAPLSERVGQFERQVIADALRDNQGRIGVTAEALGIPRKTLYLRMRKFGLHAEDYQAD